MALLSAASVRLIFVVRSSIWRWKFLLCDSASCMHIETLERDSTLLSSPLQLFERLDTGVDYSPAAAVAYLASELQLAL